MYSSGVQAHRERVVGLACAAKRQNAVQALETAVHDVGMLSQLEHRHVLKHYAAFIEKVRDVAKFLLCASCACTDNCHHMTPHTWKPTGKTLHSHELCSRWNSGTVDRDQGPHWAARTNSVAPHAS